MLVRGENGMKKLLFPFLFTRCRYEIVRYRHFYRHKTMPVAKRHEMKTLRFAVSCEHRKRHFLIPLYFPAF